MGQKRGTKRSQDRFCAGEPLHRVREERNPHGLEGLFGSILVSQSGRPWPIRGLGSPPPKKKVGPMCMAGFQDVGSTRFTNPETGDLASKSLRRHCYSNSVAKTMTERPRFGGKLDGWKGPFGFGQESESPTCNGYWTARK